MPDDEHTPVDRHECSDLPSMAVTFPGPFEHHDVVVNGWRVPFLHAHMKTEDRVLLVLDRRLGAEFSVEEAERVVPFLADAIWYSMGHTPTWMRRPLSARTKAGAYIVSLPA